MRELKVLLCRRDLRCGERFRIMWVIIRTQLKRFGNIHIKMKLRMHFLSNKNNLSILLILYYFNL